MNIMYKIVKKLFIYVVIAFISPTEKLFQMSPWLNTTITKSTAFNICGYVSRFLDILRRNPVDFSMSWLVDYCTHFASIRYEHPWVCDEHQQSFCVDWFACVRTKLWMYYNFQINCSKHLWVCFQISGYFA